MKHELLYSKTRQWKAWPLREGESTLTAIHICHRPRIPCRHVPIERRCIGKHALHPCHRPRIPFGQVLIEVRLATKHTEHLSNRRHVPITDRAVRIAGSVV